jgi:ADP-ribosyl-[dinitrogen reductase] hydrolase
MAQDSLRGFDKNYLLHTYAHPLVAKHSAFKFRAVRQSSNPSGYIVDTLQAVFQSFFDTDNFEDCLIDVVNRGGDADTTGAIAGMLAGALYGLEAIPEVWLKTLDVNVSRACTNQAHALIRVATEV